MSAGETRGRALVQVRFSENVIVHEVPLGEGRPSSRSGDMIKTAQWRVRQRLRKERKKQKRTPTAGIDFTRCVRPNSHPPNPKKYLPTTLRLCVAPQVRWGGPHHGKQDEGVAGGWTAVRESEASLKLFFFSCAIHFKSRRYDSSTNARFIHCP